MVESMSGNSRVAGEGGPATLTIESAVKDQAAQAVTWARPLAEVVSVLEAQGLECVEVTSWAYYCHGQGRRVIAVDREILELIVTGPEEVEEPEKI